MMTVSHRIRHLRARLLDFFDEEARPLPWRETDDPYPIWVSEVMLQQTRVETVVPYYRRWMERFPDVEALADAGREEVLNLWEGLGYYSRARNLHDAARLVRERHGGRIPEDPGALRELPGVGAYTAGAVASIAFDRPEPAVDGNARRVLSRLFDIADPTPGSLRSLAAEAVDPERPGDFNQAVMELGATICTPRDPACPACPVEELCEARDAGTVEERPKPRRRTRVREVDLGVAVLVDGSATRVLLRRRPEDGLLGGMWEFPGEEAAHGEAPGEAARRVAGEMGIARDGLGEEAELPAVEHAFSHLRATYHPRMWRVEAADGVPERGAGTDGEDVRWVPLDGLSALPVPVAQRKIAAALRARWGEKTDTARQETTAP